MTWTRLGGAVLGAGIVALAPVGAFVGLMGPAMVVHVGWLLAGKPPGWHESEVLSVPLLALSGAAASAALAGAACFGSVRGVLFCLAVLVAAAGAGLGTALSPVPGASSRAGVVLAMLAAGVLAGLLAPDVARGPAPLS
ncbi:MAG: hypothetical protein M9894_27225 [Planctomycetes bacterium]|nr:hypothetical protein [Planctomycetota bacterium]